MTDTKNKVLEVIKVLAWLVGIFIIIVVIVAYIIGDRYTQVAEEYYPATLEDLAK